MMAKKRSRDGEAGQFKMVGKLTKPKPKPKKKSNNTGDVTLTMKSLSERGNEENKMHDKNEDEKKKWVVYDDQNEARVDVMEWIWDECWPLSYWYCVGENEMFWEYLKVPVWDEDDFRGGFCGYNEIIWEDDIWHLKDIKEVPKSCSLAL